MHWTYVLLCLFKARITYLVLRKVAHSMFYLSETSSCVCVCVYVCTCRLDTKESCDKTIEMLNGSTLQDSTEPLLVKFADSSSNKKRQLGPGRKIQYT